MTRSLFQNIQVGKENAEIALLLVEYDKELKVLILLAYNFGSFLSLLVS